MKASLRSIISDISLWVLVVINIVTIINSITEKWNFTQLLLVYWCQSIVIGIISLARILTLKDFHADNFTFRNRPAKTKLFNAGFFVVHYGLFHLGYYMYITHRLDFDSTRITALFWFSISLFIICHIFSFFYNHAEDLTTKPDIGLIMIRPYGRIIPMHLSLLLVGLFPVAIFLSIKTLVDAGTHILEHLHYNLRQKESRL
jgi:hypothetical protein